MGRDGKFDSDECVKHLKRLKDHCGLDGRSQNVNF